MIPKEWTILGVYEEDDRVFRVLDSNGDIFSVWVCNSRYSWSRLSINNELQKLILQVLEVAPEIFDKGGELLDSNFGRCYTIHQGNCACYIYP